MADPERERRRRRRFGVLRQDLRLAGRALAGRPGWTAAGVLTFALGVAGSTLVLGLLDQAFVRPLGFGAGRELVTLYVTSGPEYSPLPYPDYAEFRTALEDAVDLAAFCRVFMTVAGGAFPERHEGEMVSGAFFSVLGVRPALGRFVGPADNAAPGARRVVVLSDFLWRRQFGADPGMVGAPVRLNGDVYEVVGVAPPGFRGAVWPSFESAFWIPATMADDYFSGRDVLNGRSFAVFQTVGRLAPGATLAAAQARIDPVDAVLARDRRANAAAYYPETGAPWRVRVLPASYLRLWPEFRDEVAGFLGVLGLMAAAALAVACANLATLLLARAAAWRRELAIRSALGAAPADLALRLGMEVAVLVAAGGLAAAVLVVWSSGLAPLLPLTVPYRLDLAPDLRVAGIGLAVTAVTGCAFALPAAWRVLGGGAGLAALSRTGGAGRSTATSGLVVAQLAVSTVLVVGCGLLVRSAWNTQRIDQGFDAPRGASLRVAFPRAWEDDPARAAAAVDRFLDGLRAESLVVAASASTRRPGEVPARAAVRFAGSRRAGPETPVETNVNAVTADYFDAFGIPVRAGRVFGRADAAAGAPVAAVSQALAALHFPRDPVGQTLRLQGEERSRRVVAVVGDTVGRDVRLAPPPTVYVPYRRRPTGGAWVTVRARGGAADALALLRRRVRELDAGVAVSEAATFTELRRAATRESRVHAGLAAAAAGLALSLALVGLYGLTACVVRRREREIGIRMALGATPARVVGLVVGRGCRLTVFGLVPGLAASLVAGRWLSPLLHGVAPGDPPTFAVVPALFLAASAAACLGPALRAARVNPTDVLRAE